MNEFYMPARHPDYQGVEFKLAQGTIACGTCGQKFNTEVQYMIIGGQEISFLSNHIFPPQTVNSLLLHHGATRPKPIIEEDVNISGAVHGHMDYVLDFKSVRGYIRRRVGVTDINVFISG